MKGYTMATLSEDIAVIKSQLIEMNSKLNRYVDKVDEHEKEIARCQTKIDNFNVFQTVLTVVGSAIAGFLGVQK